MRVILLVLTLMLGCTGVSEELPPEEPSPVPEEPEEEPPVQEPQMTCEEYCPTQPHIQCVGYWNISGTYPDCNCAYVCEVIEEEPEEEPEEQIAEPLDKTLLQIVNEGLDKARLDFYRENDGSFIETRYTWYRIDMPDVHPSDIVFDRPTADVKFNDKTIPSISAAGFIVFEEDDRSKAYGVSVFLEKNTTLDSYFLFDIEYFPSIEHRYMKDCFVYSKETAQDVQDWVSTYFIKCGKTYDKDEN